MLVLVTWLQVAAPIDTSRAVASVCPLRETGAMSCISSARSIVLAPAAWATDMSTRVNDAGEQFRRHFGRIPGRGYLFGGAAMDSAGWNDARRAGHDAWRLPWPVEQVASRSSGTADQRRAFALSGMAHELSHLWFGAAFWPEPATPGMVRYGSGAPDWLDEVSAALLEDSLTTRSPAPRLRTGTIPFQRFLSMDHPALAQSAFLAQARARAAELRTQGASATAMQLTPPPGLGDTLALFYGQVRGLATWLATRAKGSAVFGELAQAMHAGATLDEWLRRRGAAVGWPPSVMELEADFVAWVRTAN
ncbi:MAG: hypothetical protein HOP28_07810 [Gemmatimonadales bacterium]|nr:hypothetical protein [Gemmatimonadales bacterium]